MAVTIQQEPQIFSTAGNPIVWTFESDQTAQPNFSFIVELYIQGTLYSTHQVFPQFGILSRFNASEAIKSILSSPLVINGTLTTNYNSAITNGYIIVYEKYGTPPTIGAFAQSTLLMNAFNGALRHPEFINWNYQDYNVDSNNPATPGVLFLTSWPRARKYFCGLTENIFLGFISDDTALNVRFRLKDSAGVTIATDLVSVTFNDLTVVDASPATIIANTTITALDFAAAAYYEVIARGVGIGINNGSSETFKIYIDNECHRYPTRRLHWLNKFGVWDSFTFTLVSTESTKVSGSTYERESGVWSGTNYIYPLYQGEITTYSKRAEDTMILNSDWIYEDVQQWLVRELYESPNVYLEASTGSFEPVNITNQGYDLKQSRKDGLIRETIEIKKTYSYNSQLN
jgi:hypothetical protein